jgi:hypothetical protein
MCFIPKNEVVAHMSGIGATVLEVQVFSGQGSPVESGMYFVTK